MDLRYNMIIANGRNITPDVAFCKYNPKTKKYDVRFNNGKVFSYNYKSISWLREPKTLNPSDYRIFHGNRKLTEINEINKFNDGHDEYWHICFKNGRQYALNRNDLKLTLPV